MMFEYPPGATPIDADEAEGLIPGHITTRAQLNEWEQTNIATAAAWIRTARLDPLDLLAVKELHGLMFDRTWSWAGQLRTTEKTIGAGALRREYIASSRAAVGGDYANGSRRSRRHTHDPHAI